MSRASATARASPSTGAYLDSAGWVKRLPTKVIFQPVLQQNGSVEVQLQCFWNSQKPIPFLDQSVARFVEYADPLFDFAYDGSFGFVEEAVKGVVPVEWDAWFQ